MSKRIEVIARGVLLDRGRVLLCRDRAGGYSYLPGGKIEHDEAAIHALEREFEEECGLEVLATPRPVMACECFFIQRGSPRHEINLVFHVERRTQDPEGPGSAGDDAPTAPPVPASRESDIEFWWADLAAVPDLDLRPRPIKAWLAAGGWSPGPDPAGPDAPTAFTWVSDRDTGT